MEEVSEVRRICRYLPLLSLLCVPLASAQSSIDVNIGFGTAHDKASSTGVDGNTGLPCSPSSDSACLSTPSLSNLFMGLGANIMLQKHYGFGFEAAFQPVRQDWFPGVQYRETFYDFNGIYAPINEKRVVLELQGGIGGARTSFSVPVSTCSGIVSGCGTQAEAAGGETHFQLHVGAGVQIFLTEHLFVRPQYDFRYVPNLTNEFNSTVVHAGMIWVGYSFGSRQ